MVYKRNTPISTLLKELLALPMVLLGIGSPFLAITTKYMLVYMDSFSIHMGFRLPEPMKWFSTIHDRWFYLSWIMVAFLILLIYIKDIIDFRRQLHEGREPSEGHCFLSVYVSISCALFFSALSCVMITDLLIFLSTLLEEMVKK